MNSACLNSQDGPFSIPKLIRERGGEPNVKRARSVYNTVLEERVWSTRIWNSASVYVVLVGAERMGALVMGDGTMTARLGMFSMSIAELS